MLVVIDPDTGKSAAIINYVCKIHYLCKNFFYEKGKKNRKFDE